MKKILYILSNEPTGGVGKFVLDFTSHFTHEIKIDYLIYTDIRDTDFQKNIKKNNNTIYYLPELNVRNYIKLYKLTDDFFATKACEYEICHLTYPGIARMCLKPAKKYGIKHRIIHSLNTRLSDNPLKSLINKLLNLNYKKYANHYFSCSHEASVYLYGKKLGNSQQITYIHNAIDCNEYKYNINERIKFRKSSKINDQYLILCVGRLENQKNISFAIDVFIKMHQIDNRCVLMIIGDGPLKKKLEQKVEKSGYSNYIRFIGFTKNLPKYFNGADLLLLPSLYEGLPITAISAQNCGLPCLLSANISKETKLTEIVKFVKLDADILLWVNQAFELLLIPRKEHIKEISEKGYNIINESKKLEDIYKELYVR